MKIGDLLVEAKLTENDFQSKTKAVVESYQDFSELFDRRALPRAGDCYLSYQLIRNVLAAHTHGCSFCVMADARRPDLMEAWYAVMRCVKPGDLRRRCKMLTWQELSLVLPRKLQDFLEEKYGIAAGDRAMRAHAGEVDAWN
jgi:alkylhydroperoxidase family enzyme